MNRPQLQIALLLSSTALSFSHVVFAQEKATTKKSPALVTFESPTPYLHQKTQPTISSADGKWRFWPILLVQGDWAHYSKSQPLSTPGTDNLKSSGENIRRGWRATHLECGNKFLSKRRPQISLRMAKCAPSKHWCTTQQR